MKAAWNRNLTRLRSYAERLDSAGTRPELVAAVGYLATLRTPLARDGVELMAGLRRLGGANCDLRTPINTKTFPLPPLKKPERASHGAGAGNGATSGLSASNESDSSTGSAGSTGATATPQPRGSTGTGGTTGGGATGGSTGTGGTVGGGESPGTGTPGDTGGGGGPSDGG